MKNKLILFGILCCTILVFFPALNGEYLIGWDDDFQILKNNDVLVFNWDSVVNYFTSFYVRSYQPLASLSFGIEYALFGENPFIPHLVNLCIHLINIVLVAVFTAKISGLKTYFRWFIIGLFAMHPLQAELLGWISTRSSLLYSMFMLLSLIHYLNYLNTNKKYFKYWIYSFVFFTLSLLSKSAAVIIPVILVLMEYVWYRQPIRKKAILHTLPFFTGSLIIGLVSIKSREIVNTIADFSNYYTFYEKTSLFFHSLVLYIEKSFLASDLIVFYGFPFKINSTSIPTSFLLAPAIISLVGLGVYFLYRNFLKNNQRLFLFGILFFVINLILVLNITPFTNTFFSERYTYIAMLGLFLSAAIILQQILENNRFLKIPMIVLFGYYVLHMAYQANQRAHIWNTQETLWSHVVAAGSQTDYPYTRLGQYYAKQGHFNRAIEVYNKGVKINPQNAGLYYYRGIAIKETGNLNYANKDFMRAIQGKSKLIGDAYYQRSLVYKQLNKPDSASIALDSAKVYNFNQALFDSNANETLGIQKLQNIEKIILTRIDSLQKANNLEALLKAYESLTVLSPNNANYHLNQGLTSLSLNLKEEALKAFTKSIELNKTNPIPYLSRAYTYSVLKEHTKAIADYSFSIDSLKETRKGEVYYFRALSYINTQQKEKACADLNAAIKNGYKVPDTLLKQACQ